MEYCWKPLDAPHAPVVNFTVEIDFGDALRFGIDTRRKENERVRCMKTMIRGSFYDTCLSFVSTGAHKGKGAFLEENR